MLLIPSFVVLSFIAGLCSAIPCPNGTYRIAESIPLGLPFSPVDTSTFEAWADIISRAQHTIDLAAFYVTLTDEGYPPIDGGEFGEQIYDLLRKAHLERGVRIRVVEQMPTESMPDIDAINLWKEGIIELRNINWEELVGNGILHTKLLISDDQHIYVGSANCGKFSCGKVLW